MAPGSIRLLCTIALFPLVASAAQWTAPDGPPPGRLVAVGDHRMHLRCMGPETGRPVVVLEAGSGGSSRDWTQVQQALAPSVRTCAYDRAGSAWSEPGPSPRTMRQEVFELHALLREAGVSSPFVLVGQSLGGLLVRLYAAEYGDDVAGVVLVEPTHESAVLGSVRYGGWVRLREKATDRPVPPPLERGERRPYSEADDYLAEELAAIHTARLAAPRSLGDRPLVIMAGGRRPAPPPGTSEEQWRTLRDERDAQLRELASLSSRSTFEVVADGGHNLHVERPTSVVAAIERVVRESVGR